MDVDFETLLRVVRDFISRRRHRPADAIVADTGLLRDGWIDSFGLIELIAELEPKLGLSLPDGSLIPEDFETPRVLYARLIEL